MRRIELMSKKERRKMEKRKLVAEYARLVKELRHENKKFARFLEIKGKLEL